MLTTLVENWPGFRDGIMGPDLMAEMRAQAERFGAEIIRGHVTVGRSRGASVHRQDAATPSITTPDADHRDRRLRAAARAAVGAALIGHGVSTCATCDGYFFRGKPIAVVGGGDSAMEEAIFLTRFASHVTVVHRRDTLRASKIMQDKAFANPKISLRVEHAKSRRSSTSAGAKSTAMVLRNTVTGERKELPVEACSSRSATRRTPRSSRVSSSMDPNGYIVTHDGTRTSVAGRVRLRRRAGSRLPAGDHRGRLGLHGRDRRGEVSGRPAAAPGNETPAPNAQ